MAIRHFVVLMFICLCDFFHTDSCSPKRSSVRSVSKTQICSDFHFECDSGQCIEASLTCDKINDCADNSDEKQCDYIFEDKLDCGNDFLCDDPYCVHQDLVCDGIKNCPDGSDEWNCSVNKTFANDCKTENFQYLCKNKRCIPLDLVCNKKDDCGDGSDELLFLYFTDIDVCQTYGICEKCVNSPESYSCKCQTNYLLQDDNNTRKEHGKLHATGMFNMYFDSKTHLKRLNYAVGIATSSNYTYWSNIEESSEIIVRSNSTIISSAEIIVTTGLLEIAAIAVDWITGNMYYSDKGYNRIGVCDNSATYCTVIIIDIDKPAGIALLPTRGKMYWSDWGSNPHIAVAGMDGKNIRTFVSKNIEWPKSLTIDYPDDRLYWVDSKSKIIESIRLDGTDRRLVVHNTISEPSSLLVMKDILYWNDWEFKLIKYCNKFTEKNCSFIDLQEYGYDVSISIMAQFNDLVIKPESNNPCLSNPCSELCLLNQNKGYKCACTLDKRLRVDGRTCQEAKKKPHLLIYADKLINYYHELLGKPKIISTSLSLKSISVQEMMYDSLSGQIIILDMFSENMFSENIFPIKSANILGYDLVSNNFRYVTSFDTSIFGMTFDHIGNNVYTTNVYDASIEIRNLKTQAMTVFYFTDIPYYITLAPEENKMYVAFKKERNFLINYPLGKFVLYEMDMNGLGEKKQLKKLVGPKISMCYNRHHKTLFVSDETPGVIYSYFNGDFILRIFRNNLKRPISLATAEDYIFWIESNSKILYWTDFQNILHRNHKAIAMYMPINSKTPLMITVGENVKYDHDCQKNNGNCSHVCLPSSVTSFICACPPGMALSSNNRTCVVYECPKNLIKCKNHNICIQKENVCDGITNCPNNEDEMLCYKETNCEENQFTCTNGDCISLKNRCNGFFDCIDYSDEYNCTKSKCKSDEFQCHGGVTLCISKSFLCDDDFDCEDGSDETPEACFWLSEPCLGEFQCNDGNCISPLMKCNNINDCLDGSDEWYCDGILETSNHLVNCTKDEYRCHNTNICLPEKVRCNGVRDCPKNDDEHNCTFCFEYEFGCNNTKCIPSSRVCDKKNDCGDNSDEDNCNGDNKTITESNECHEFKCSTGTCLLYSKVCDGIRDCPDGSDENGNCQTACVRNNCKDLCHKTPKGGVCNCQDGYRLAADAISCENINECENDICSQICRNIMGSFECLCHEGYVIRSDKVSCKAIGPAMEFITITDFDIRKISFNLHSVEVIHPLKGLHVNGLDVNVGRNSVYWSNYEFGTIQKYNIETKETTIMIAGHPQALAVDWITDNVYVNDNDHLNTIKVCNLEKERCAMLVKIKDEARVESIVVDSVNRWLFWAQITWRVDKPFSKIYRTDMMGADIKMIDFHLGFVTGMALDHIKSKLYWSDSFNKVIESFNLDGSQRSTFFSSKFLRPLSIGISEQTLYWLSDKNGPLRSCKLYGEKSCYIMNEAMYNVYKQFTIFHISRQPVVKNPCDEKYCDYMCVLKKENATCICSHDEPIKSNSSCMNKQKVNKNTWYTSVYAIYNGKIIVYVTIIVLLVGVLLCVYFYLKNKLKWKQAADSNIPSVCFQNLTYNQGDEVAIGSIAGDVSPEEYEYINEYINIDNKFLNMKTAKESNGMNGSKQRSDYYFAE